MIHNAVALLFPVNLINLVCHSSGLFQRMARANSIGSCSSEGFLNYPPFSNSIFPDVVSSAHVSRLTSSITGLSWVWYKVTSLTRFSFSWRSSRVTEELNVNNTIAWYKQRPIMYFLSDTKFEPYLIPEASKAFSYNCFRKASTSVETHIAFDTQLALFEDTLCCYYSPIINCRKM